MQTMFLFYAGAKVVSFFRTDLIRKFDDFDDDTVAQYVFQCNARKPRFVLVSADRRVIYKSDHPPFEWVKITTDRSDSFK